jgi:hypothetical protein
MSRRRRKKKGKGPERNNNRRFETFDRVLTLIHLGFALKPWISWLIARCHDQLD